MPATLRSTHETSAVVRTEFLGSRKPILWLSLLALLLVAWMLASTSWICDDAFVTFRSVEQVVDGNGPRWNPHERVQAFTHPLWFLLLVPTRALLGDPAQAAQLLSFVLALATFWILVRRARGSVAHAGAHVLLVLALVFASRAFVDFSSSGLEDPLSHLLLVVFALGLPRRGEPVHLGDLRRASWAGGLLLLCRHDNLFLVAPPLLWLAWTAWRRDGRSLLRTVRAAALGFLPFAAWTVFSLVYYGFPFPNTAYAKLNTGVAGHELWLHGVRYLTHTAVWDPVTLLGIVVGGWLWARAGAAGPFVALGMALHLLYVVRVGGDFMAGRFLTEPFAVALSAVALLPTRRPAHIPSLAPRAAGLVAVGLLVFVVLWPLSPLRIDDAYASYHPDDHHGIADERAFYTGRSSHEGFERRWPVALWQAQDDPQEHFEVGFSSYAVGTDRLVIDRFALADPLLARLPADDEWKRVGHFKRSVPAGYAETLRTLAAGRYENRIENPFVHRLYDDLRLVTQEPLFTAERWRAIVRLNLAYRRPGCVAPPCRRLATHLLPPALYRPLLPAVHPSEGEVALSPQQTADASTWVAEGRLPFDLLQDDQLLRFFLPTHPVRDELELLPGQDPDGDLEGFRVTLTFGDPPTARRAAGAFCVAVAAEGGAWRLLPRLDAGGAVCTALVEETPAEQTLERTP